MLGTVALMSLGASLTAVATRRPPRAPTVPS
jgi:hypothetical protein